MTFKTLFFNRIKEICGSTKDIAVALSAGKDSNAILLSLLELGYKPHGYSFHILDIESTDFKVARDNCKKLNVPFTECVLPAKADKDLVLELIRYYDRKTKVAVECHYPYFYLFARVREPILLIGLSAGIMMPLSKKACIHFKNNPQKLQDWRRYDFDKITKKDLEIFNDMLRDKGKKCKLDDPFYSEEILSWFNKQEWKTLHSPNQKQVLIDLFPERWKEIVVTPQTSLQCGDSGIRTSFEHLLLDEKLNYKKRTRMIDLYKDTYERARNAETELL
jgi:hypothetical protein